jgi:membrane associated rhomboid family serine protease
MSTTQESSQIYLLREIARSDPQPWHYKGYVERTGANVEGVFHFLEMLHLENLIESTEGDPQLGPAVRLTQKGRDLLRDPDAVDRFNEGQPLDSDDLGSVIRSRCLTPTAHTVTKLLLWINLAVFGYCLFLARGDQNLLTSYLMMSNNPQIVKDILQPAGGVNARDILNGEYWRLFTSMWVHAGGLHLLMNMYFLWGVGKLVEDVYGRGRFVMIYLIGGWGGACLAVALSPVRGQAIVTGVGASGALCGALMAALLFFVLYGKYLPRKMARSGRNSMLFNVVLMVAISFVPGVSAMGHLGGAIAGGLATLAFAWQDFGPKALRFLTFILLVLIPIGSFVHLQTSRGKEADWQLLEIDAFADQLGDSILNEMILQRESLKRPLMELLARRAVGREERDVAAVIAKLKEKREAVEKLMERLKKFRAKDDAIKEIQETGLQGLQTIREVCDDAIALLEAGENGTREQERALRKKIELSEDLQRAWRARTEAEIEKRAAREPNEKKKR